MTRKKPHLTSGLLPSQIVALGAQEPDDEKAFRVANASYRTICALASVLSLRWLGENKARRQAPEENTRQFPIT